MCTVLHPAVPMLWMSHPHLFWSLWRETSHIRIVPRFSFSKTKSDRHARAFSGSMKVMGSGGSSSWLYGLPGVIFIHFLNRVCFFLIASQLKFERCPQPPPALLSQGAVVCCTVVPWGCPALPHRVFPGLRLKQVRQQPLTTAQLVNQATTSSGQGSAGSLHGQVSAKPGAFSW